MKVSKNPELHTTVIVKTTEVVFPYNLLHVKLPEKKNISYFIPSLFHTESPQEFLKVPLAL